MDTKVFTPEVYDQLTGQFGTDIANQLNERRFAPLLHQNGHEVPYVRVFPPIDVDDKLDKPVLYVPGFTEGEVAKAPFAAALAQRGVTVLLPGQNRAKIVQDAVTGKNATFAQARTMMSVIKHEGLADGGFDVVTHSYGSLIFGAMTAVADYEGLRTFEGARVIALAPAGMNPRENPLRLGLRFARSNLAESRLEEQEFRDVDGSMLKAGIANFSANILRGWNEVRELYRNRLNIQDMFTSAKIGSLAVVAYAHDATFPYKVIDRTVGEALDKGLPVSYLTPYASEPNFNGVIMGRRESTHNDEQFQPTRVANTVMQLLHEPLL
jgi:pimeloyl-ACP methyl ester carboxylesterase